MSAAYFSQPVYENLNVLYHLSYRDISCPWFLRLQNSFPLWEAIGVQPKTCQFWIVLDMHLAVHKIFYWYWSEIAAVIVFSRQTWISLSTFYFAFLKFGFCSCFAWKVIRSDVSCTTHFNILDKLRYVFIPVDRFLIWSMGRYLTSGVNIPPARSSRVILSVFCHHDFLLLLLFLFVYLLTYFQACFWISCCLLSGLSSVSRCHGWGRCHSLRRDSAAQSFVSVQNPVAVIFWYHMWNAEVGC